MINGGDARAEASWRHTNSAKTAPLIFFLDYLKQYPSFFLRLSETAPLPHFISIQDYLKPLSKKAIFANLGENPSFFSII